MWTRHAIVLLALLGSVSAAAAQTFRIDDVSSATGTDVAQLKPGTIAFSDQHDRDAADSDAYLIRFEDWASKHPNQKKFLALFPGYTERRATPATARRRSVERQALHVCRAGALHARPRAGYHRPVALRDAAVSREDRSSHQAHADHRRPGGAVAQRRRRRQRQSRPQMVHRPRNLDLHPVDLQARRQDSDRHPAGEQAARQRQENLRSYRFRKRAVGARARRRRSAGRAAIDGARHADFRRARTGHFLRQRD